MVEHLFVFVYVKLFHLYCRAPLAVEQVYIEAHYFFFCFLEELSFGKVLFMKTAKYSSLLNDISKKNKRFLKNSKRVLKGKSGTFGHRNEFLEKKN